MCAPLFDAPAFLRYCKAMQEHLITQSLANHAVMGIDEAGRGCLAGPVVAAAVLLPQHCLIEGLDDSKKLTAARRTKLVREIYLHAQVGIGLVWQKDIDSINILQATFHAMSKAVRSLLGRHTGIERPFLRIDGNKCIPAAVLARYVQRDVLPSLSQECIIGGDGLVPAIGAASIVAKTHRDHIMTLLHKRYPQYNFAGHKGYGTKEHVAAIMQHGPCPLHRMTFAPLSSMAGAEAASKKKAAPSCAQGSLL